MNERESRRIREKGIYTEVSISEKKTALKEWQIKFLGILTVWSILVIIQGRIPMLLFLLVLLLYSSYTDFREQAVYNLPVALYMGTAIFFIFAGRVWENRALPVFLGMTAIVLILGIVKVWGLGDSNLIICIGLWMLLDTREPLAFLIRVVVVLLIASVGFIIALLITRRKKGPFVPFLTAGLLIETVLRQSF